MRIIIPPLTSQYLNLTKNSSLAAAIAYPDLISTLLELRLTKMDKHWRRCYHNDRLSESQFTHLRLYELVQLSRRLGGAVVYGKSELCLFCS